MAFSALLCSKRPETNTAVVSACKSAEIHAEVCPDIFSAIEKGKTQPFSCLIVDWADQPEASFLLRRARESTPNRETVAIAIVDHDPTAAEMKDNRLDFLIYRPIAADEAREVLAKACERMKPVSAEDIEKLAKAATASAGDTRVSSAGAEAEHSQDSPRPDNSLPAYPGADAAADANGGEIATDVAIDEDEHRPRGHGSSRSSAFGFRGTLAAVFVLAAAFCLWRSHGAIEYLARTPEGGFRVLRESVSAFFYMNNSGALPVASAGTDAKQDEYFSRVPASSNAPTPALGVVATESTLPETHTALPKAADFPLSAPVLEHQDDGQPVRVERAVIPESMKNSPPITPPDVVAVNPAQMMPVSVPASQPAIQQTSEPVAVSEEAARALLIHSVDPQYPPEAMAQKLHGPVVLQAVVGRDGSVEDLKLVRGYFILGQAAIAAVKQWRFKPYTLNGRAAATQTTITINFTYPPG